MAGMGRPRGFDEVAVLDASAEQFGYTVRGYLYRAAVRRGRSRRSSLYNTFTSKDNCSFARWRSVAVAKEQQESVLTGRRTVGS